MGREEKEGMSAIAPGTAVREREEREEREEKEAEAEAEAEAEGGEGVEGEEATSGVVHLGIIALSQTTR